ncbi:tetratricopeptide repeat protein [Nibricoccus sp. IMCC34717]|uniref:tetratricopeptide repeat protein n=1 Tax=Nibricoccus sp. IMCC34717 TaxID=3034021 RepID=UPI00384DA64B
MADPRRDLASLKAALQAGRAREALPGLEALARADPRNLEVWFLLGIGLVSVGRHADALPVLERVAKAAPKVADVHNNLGVALRHLGRVEEAERAFRQSLVCKADYPEAHLNLAQLLLARGRADEAAGLFLRTIQLAPSFVEALLGLGDSLRACARANEAREAYTGYTTAKPGDANGWNSLGVVEQMLGNLAAAETALRRALALQPAHASAAANLSAVLLQQNRVDEALRIAREAVAAHPRSADAANNLALVLLRRHEPAAAETALRNALACDPAHRDARLNLANALHDLGRTADAIAELERLLAAAPEFRAARFHLACMRLVTGDFARGWENYEARPSRSLRAAPPPDWDLRSPLDGRTLLVHAEQGLGDTLNFARYVPVLADRAARVVFEVQPALLPVLEPLRTRALLVAPGSPEAAQADMKVPLLSLPLAFRTTAADLPPVGNWISVSEERIQRAARLLGARSQPRLGLVWAGNPAHTNDHNRSLPLARLLAGIPGRLSLFSLQKEVPAADAALLAATPTVRNLAPELRDFGDTAAVLRALDGLVTVDTSVAHLAGALGVPTWLLLPTPCDWRWLEGRTDSPWYPSVRLLRQRVAGDWAPALAELHATLNALAHA